MPQPVYQRPLGWMELSTRTATTLSCPTGFSSGVMSRSKEL